MSDITVMPRERFEMRRRHVREMLGNRAAIVLAAAPELHVVPDTELRYVVDSELYYLTGYAEPEAVLVITSEMEGYTLFVRPRDAERELWTGVRGGLEAAQDEFGAATAYPIASLATELPRLLGNSDRIYARAGARADVDAAIRSVLSRARKARPRTGRGAAHMSDPGEVLDDLRIRKDDDEIRLIRNAAAISVAAFVEAARQIGPGVGEWEVEAALQSGFRRRRASGEAFSSIVGGGANGTVLHYTANNDVLEEGSFVLIDAGARANMYCADITRTYAVGAMSSQRMALHDIVRSAHDAAVARCRPGNTIEDVDAAARRELVRGLIDMKLITGPIDDALGRDEYKAYYPHRTCHWLGLDVHDVGSYVGKDGLPRILEPGMVFTVEPGLYIPRLDPHAHDDVRGTGIRLEDDVLITLDGCDVLTAALPLDAVPG